MKTLMYLVLAAVSLFGSGLLAADNFYYEYSTPISLTATDDYVVVKQDDQSFTPLLDIIAGNPALSTIIHPLPVASGFIRLGLNSGYSAEEVVDGLRQTTGILYANNLYRFGDSLWFYPADLLYLHFKTTTSDADIDSIMQAYSLAEVATLYGDHYIRIVQTTRNTPLDVITTGNQLFESGLFVIARASFCLPFQKFSSPNDSYYSYQWNLKNDGSYGRKVGADIHYEGAMEYNIPTTPLVVGIIDDGFESHADFSGTRIIGGWDYYYGRADFRPGPKEAHGMACMGILGAASDNNEGIAGITPSSIQIVGQKIFPDSGDDCALDAMVALAFDSCRIKGAKLISNSWGDEYCESCSSSVINEAIRRADSAGISIVFSSGNQGWYQDFVAYPGKLPQVLAVGATDAYDQRWYYSMHGPELDVVAPSSDIWFYGDIWSLDRSGYNGYNPQRITCSPQDEDYDCKFGGTSAACPEVSGIIALLMLRRSDLIGQTALIRAVIDSSSEDQVGEDGYDTPGWDAYYGNGRVNADRALMAIVRGDADNNGTINISDAVYLIYYIFSGGMAPQPHVGVGDVNCDGAVNVSDAIYLYAYIFGGPAPVICYHYTY